MKSIFLCLSLTILNLECISQNLPKPQKDSVSLSINLIQSLIKYSEHGECYIEAKLTNNSKTTIFYIDDNNMALANYVTDNDSLWIWRSDFVGGPRPIMKSLMPDSSITEKFAVFGFKNSFGKFKIGFDLIITNKREDISKKGRLLYKKTDIIWSNSLNRLK